MPATSQKPAISSFVSAKGPSITVRVLPENRTRAPFELACNPSPASIMFRSCRQLRVKPKIHSVLVYLG